MSGGDLRSKNARSHTTTLSGASGQRTTELEAAARELEAVSRALAHDLRKPLRNIHALSGVLAQDCSGRLPNRHVKHLKQVHAAADRMTRMVDLLLGTPKVSECLALVGAPIGGTFVSSR